MLFKNPLISNRSQERVIMVLEKKQQWESVGKTQIVQLYD